MPLVNVEGVGRIRFPDAMSREQIAQAIEGELMPQVRREALKRSNPAEYDPASPEYQAKYGATAGMSGLDKFRAGMGKAFTDTGRGLEQLAVEGARAVLPGAAGDFLLGNKADELRAQQDEIARRDAPLMQTGAGLAGNVAGHVAEVMVPGGVTARAASMPRLAAAGRALMNPSTYRAAGAVGAAQGAALPVGTEDSRLRNVATGAALGMTGNAAANTLARVARPVGSTLSAAGQRAVRTLEDAGVPLDAAQRSGNALLGRLKSGLTDNPYTAGPQLAALERQQTGFNRAALRTIGADADTATPDVMAAARSRIGQMFDQAADTAGTIPLGADDLRSIVAIRDEAGRVLNDGRIGAQVSNILSKIDDAGHLDARTYQQIRGELDLLAGQRDVSPYAVRLRRALDDALAGASPEAAMILRQARPMWGNLMRIEDAVARNADGNIAPGALFNSYGKKATRGQSVYGRGSQDLVQLARAGKQLLPDRLPNSGTAARIAGQLAPAAVVGIGAQALSGDPETALKYAALTYGIPRAVQFGLNNPTAARYLAQGMPPGLLSSALTSPVTGGLLRQAPASGLLGSMQ